MKYGIDRRVRRHDEAGHHRLPRRWIPAAVLVAALPLAGCDTLLEIDAPSRVRADDLANPDNAPLLVASAVADFECAFSEWVAAGGLMGNELVDGQLAARMWPYDRRSFEESGGIYANFTCADADPGVYTTLSTARWAADNALSVSQEIGDAELTATSAAYSGYAHLLLGEAMCSAAVDGGPELTSQQMFGLAEEKFSMAASGGGPADIANMALVGRARARLNQGNVSGAASDARAGACGLRPQRALQPCVVPLLQSNLDAEQPRRAHERREPVLEPGVHGDARSARACGGPGPHGRLG